MQRASIGWIALAALGVAGIIGCAEGTEDDLASLELTNLPAEGGKGDENSIVLPPSTRPTEEDSGGGGPADAGGGATDAGTAVDSGTAVDAGGGGGVTCASSNVCTGATDLGTIAGDTGAAFKTAQGSGSQWFKIRVTENEHSFFGTSLLAKAELTSPPGTNFDLHMYVAGGSTGHECSAIKQSSTSTGSSDTTKAEWGESTISNGSPDDRTVTVEVRWVSGTCSPSAKWSLTVRGNTP